VYTSVYVNSPPSLCIWLCGTVLRSRPWDSDPDPIWIRARCGPIRRRFVNRSMGWSVYQYRFVQWRPDDDSALKLRHFMWVFVLTSFLYLLLPVVFMSLFVSFHVIIWHTLPVWLPMSLHMTSWLYTLCISLIWVFIDVILCISNSLLLGLVLLYSKVDLISYLT